MGCAGLTLTLATVPPHLCSAGVATWEHWYVGPALRPTTAATQLLSYQMQRIKHNTAQMRGDNLNCNARVKCDGFGLIRLRYCSEYAQVC